MICWAVRSTSASVYRTLGSVPASVWTIHDDLDVVAERADTFRRVASGYLI